MSYPRIRVKLWGDYGCFSRPEFKVERVSYPVMTPSAARGALEAIFWKPEMRFEVRRIGILQQGSQTVILRNEIETRQGENPIIVEDKRQQRSSLILKNVAYLIEAEVKLRPHAQGSEDIRKYSGMFIDRLNAGQCHHTPYLGTREFAANFAAVTDEKPNDMNLKIGTMLFDMAFIESKSRRELSFRRPDTKAVVPGYTQALFFNAEVQDGWLEVPATKYAELERLEAGRVS
jgi:CRISPR-associated protein Cas5d